MESSPKGRTIERLTGNADPIIARGNEITSLGEKMISSAALLKSIADGASGQKGLAVDKLKDVVGDVHEELELAGKRYQPTGPVLVTYGTVLAEVQPLISTAVKNCQEDWVTYTTKNGATTDPTGFGSSGSEPLTPEERVDAIEEAQGVADAAYDAWRAEAVIFDGHYDTWEEAFEKAADDIGKATDGGIEDGFWDDVDGFVAGALEVLKWVGLALAVLCIIIGGPFLAALAAIVAIATLLLTIYSFSRGNSTGWDLAFAVIGVIPFGSMGKLFSGGKMSFLDDMVGGLGSAGGRAAITGEFANLTHGLATGFSRGGSFFPGLVRGARGGFMSLAGPNGWSAGDVISRLFTGKSMNYFSQGGADGLGIVSGVWGDGFVKNLFGIPDTIGDFHNKW